MNTILSKYYFFSDGPSSKSVQSISLATLLHHLSLLLQQLIAHGAVTLTCNFAKLGDRWQALSP